MADDITTLLWTLRKGHYIRMEGAIFKKSVVLYIYIYIYIDK